MSERSLEDTVLKYAVGDMRIDGRKAVVEEGNVSRRVVCCSSKSNPLTLTPGQRDPLFTYQSPARQSPYLSGRPANTYASPDVICLKSSRRQHASMTQSSLA